jgi:hypothetical protein
MHATLRIINTSFNQRQLFVFSFKSSAIGNISDKKQLQLRGLKYIYSEILTHDVQNKKSI